MQCSLSSSTWTFASLVTSPQRPPFLSLWYLFLYLLTAIHSPNAAILARGLTGCSKEETGQETQTMATTAHRAPPRLRDPGSHPMRHAIASDSPRRGGDELLNPSGSLPVLGMTPLRPLQLHRIPLAAYFHPLRHCMNPVLTAADVNRLKETASRNLGSSALDIEVVIARNCTSLDLCSGCLEGGGSWLHAGLPGISNDEPPRPSLPPSWSV